MPRIRALAALVLAAVAAIGSPPAPATHPTSLPGAGAPHGGPSLDPAPPPSPAGHLRAWSGTPGDVPGKIVYDADELIVTDHPFDDRGADTDGNDGRTLNPAEYYSLLEGANAATAAAGDYVYPDGFGRNGADIVEVRVAADAEAWYVLAIFNTILDAERTAFEARIAGRTLLVHGTTATLDGTPVIAAADAAQNTYEVRVPRSVYDPGDGTHAMFVAAGLWDPANATWLDPDPASAAAPYFDLAYVPDEGIDSYWREKKQAHDIATGSFEDDAFDVDFAVLEPGPCGCFSITIPQSQPFTRVFRSGQPLGEGVAPQTRWNQSSSFPYNVYRSRYQPYAIYVPPGAAPGPKPLMLLDHFLGGNHMSYPITSWPQMKRWADPLGIIVAMPLGRGEAGWYEAEAEKDVFEVWRDVAQHYDIDRERVYIAGMSMGGFGAWRLGHLYPDQFAAAISWAGPLQPYAISLAPAPVMYPQQNPPACDRDTDGCGYTLTDLFGNASNVPYLVVHGGADELVPSPAIELQMRAFEETQSAYRYVLYPQRRHETNYPGSTAHWVNEFLGDLPARQRAPATVRYTVVRDFADPAFGLSYDGAYWVDGMRLAPGAEEGSIVAYRGAIRTIDIEDRFGLDELGPYRVRGRDTSTQYATTSSVSLHMRELAEVAIDTARIGWDPGGSNNVSGRTDEPVRVTLRGAFATGLPFVVWYGNVSIERSGSDVVIVAAPGAFAIELNPAP